MIVELGMTKRDMGDEDENNLENYERMGEIRGTTFLNGFGRTRTGVITCRIANCLCYIGDRRLTCIWKSLKSQVFMIIFPYPFIPPFLVPNSTIIYEHKVKSSLSISRFHNQQLTPSIAYTEYCLHRVLPTPSTAYTENSILKVQHTRITAYMVYCIIIWSTAFRSQPAFYPCADHAVMNSLISHNYKLTHE